MPQITLTAEIQPEQMGQRLDQTLAELFPEYSRSRLKTWIEAKLVKMNGEIADIPRAKVYGGEQIEISVFQEKKSTIFNFFYQILFLDRFKQLKFGEEARPTLQLEAVRLADIDGLIPQE
jgi:23S rRNA-/tRNA-specific pseudouridylate synthase